MGRLTGPAGCRSPSALGSPSAVKVAFASGFDPGRGALEFVMDVGRLPSGGDVKAPAEGSGPTFVTTSSGGTLWTGTLDTGTDQWFLLRQKWLKKAN